MLKTAYQNNAVGKHKYSNGLLDLKMVTCQLITQTSGHLSTAKSAKTLKTFQSFWIKLFLLSHSINQKSNLLFELLRVFECAECDNTSAYAEISVK